MISQFVIPAILRFFFTPQFREFPAISWFWKKNPKFYFQNYFVIFFRLLTFFWYCFCCFACFFFASKNSDYYQNLFKTETRLWFYRQLYKNSIIKSTSVSKQNLAAAKKWARSIRASIFSLELTKEEDLSLIFFFVEIFAGFSRDMADFGPP